MRPNCNPRSVKPARKIITISSHSGFFAKPTNGAMAMESTNSTQTGISPILSIGRLSDSPPSVPPIWKIVVLSAACDGGRLAPAKIVGSQLFMK